MCKTHVPTQTIYDSTLLLLGFVVVNCVFHIVGMAECQPPRVCLMWFYLSVPAYGVSELVFFGGTSNQGEGWSARVEGSGDLYRNLWGFSSACYRLHYSDISFEDCDWKIS